MSSDAPTIADGTPSLADEPAGPRDDHVTPGTLIGRYLVIDEMGRGGMGVVVRAYDPRLQREVALKLLRTRAMSDRSRERMIREARAMAKLSHRNVVAVYDVESEGPSVVLAMELIDGVTLREWLATEPGWEAIVDVFLEAGEGLAAAHRADLLHRDFKPGNVLVAAAEAGPARVCVTDFGLARSHGASSSGPDGGPATTGANADGDGSLSGDASLTVAGTVVGTPAYMAPEQHAGRELTPAADQYAFCVALWEALAGARPFAGRGTRELDKAKRGGPPKWPSNAVPAAIGSAIRRGLAVSPGDRHASMGQLLTALSRVRTRSASRSLRVAGAMVIAAAAAVVASVIASPDPARCSGAAAELSPAWGAQSREAAEHGILATDVGAAPEAWRRASTDLDAYAAAWQGMHLQTCEATTIRGEQSAHVMDLRMACLARARVALGAVAQRLATADADVVANAHALVDGLPPLPRCADIEALTAAVAPPPSAITERVAELGETIAHARADRTAGKMRESAAALEAIEGDVRATDYAPLLTEWAALLGQALHSASRAPEAEPRLREALRSALVSGQWDEVVEVAAALVGVLRELARPEEGLSFTETAWGVLPRTSTPALLEATLRSAVGGTLRHQARYDEALTEYETALKLRAEALGADHHLVAQVRNSLANVLRDRGDHDQARVQYEAALEGLASSLGPRHPAVAASHISLGTLYARTGKFQEAEQHTRLAIDIATEALGPHSHRLGSAYANLGGVFARQGKLEDALAQQYKAAAIWEAELGADHPDVVMERGNNIAQTLMSLERYEEAEAAARPALATMLAAFSPEHPRVSMLQMCLAGILVSTGRSAEAEPLVRAALASREATLGPGHADVATTRVNLGKILLSQGRTAEAEATMREGLLALERALGSSHPEVAMARANLDIVANQRAAAEPARP